MNNTTACFTGYRSIFPLCLFLKASKYNFCRKIHKASAQLIKYSPPTLAENQARHISAMKENHRKLKTTGYNWRTLHNPRKMCAIEHTDVGSLYTARRNDKSTAKTTTSSHSQQEPREPFQVLDYPHRPPKSPAKFFVVSMPRVITLRQDKASQSFTWEQESIFSFFLSEFHWCSLPYPWYHNLTIY